jgi:hypothetical protein
LVAAKVRERLAVREGSVNKMVMDTFNLRKLNEGEVKVQYQEHSRTNFQPWKTWRIMRILVGYGTQLERTSTFLPKIV